MHDAEYIVENAIEFWNAHERERYLALYDDEMIFVDEVTGHELHGREEFGKGFYDLWLDAYPDCRIEKQLVFTDGTFVCFQGRFIGTHTGILKDPEIELPPTGKSVDSPFIFISEISDGKIKGGRILYDRLTSLEQEGIVSLEQFAAELIAS